MEMVVKIGVSAACCGVLFFLFCAGLVFWYLFKQKPQEASAEAPAPAVQARIEHSTASPAASAPAMPEPTETPGADG